MSEENNSVVTQYLTFCLADEVYGVEVEKVREILDMTPITKVPRTPEYMLGVINLRGNVVPAIDMRVKFGMDPATVTRDTCIVVLEINLQNNILVIGAQADSVLEVVDLVEDNIESPPSIGTSLDIEFIRGMGKHNDQFIIILDIEKIFSSQELASITEIEEEKEQPEWVE